MIAALLAAVFVPLRDALEQVKQDVLARSAAQEAVARLAPPGAVVSHQIAMGTRSIAIRMISTQNIPSEKIRRTKDDPRRRTDRDVEITVQEVASKAELAAFVERLAAPASPAPSPPPRLTDLREDALELVGPKLKGIWPADVPITGYELAYTADSVRLRIFLRGAARLRCGGRCRAAGCAPDGAPTRPT